MKFDLMVKQAHPYHPMPDVFKCHLNLQFEKYKKMTLEKKIPNEKHIVTRFWRKRYLAFVKKEFRAMGIPFRVRYRLEDQFCDSFPELWDKWQKQKMKLWSITVKKSKGKIKNETDFAHHLQVKWMDSKKLDFMQRFFGLREEVFWRQYTRSKGLNKMSNALLSCTHWQCWKLRVKHFPFNLFYWLKFITYWRYHPEVYTAH